MIKIILNIRKFDSVAFKDGESFSKDQSFNIASIVKLEIYFYPFLMVISIFLHKNNFIDYINLIISLNFPQLILYHLNSQILHHH